MRIHHTKNKGDLGVLKAQIDLFEKGYIPCVPLTEHAEFDLIAYKDGICKRVQVKYRTAKNDCIILAFKTSWNDKNGTHVNPIDKNAIDLICIYCPDTDKCYYIKMEKLSEEQGISLRMKACKNNQTKKVHFIDDYLLP